MKRILSCFLLLFCTAAGCQQAASTSAQPQNNPIPAPVYRQKTDCVDFYQEELPLTGLGVLQLDWNSKNDTVWLLKADKSRWAQLTFSHDTDHYPVRMLIEGSPIKLDSVEKIIKPRRFKNGDYFWLELDYFSQRSGYYEVLINHETGERAWLEAKKLFTPQKYKPWLDEILTDLPGGVFNSAENPVRTAPDDAAETIALTDTCTTIEFDYKSVQGEWMYIYLPANQVTGWIRWRKGQRIQIMFMLLT